MVISLEVEVEGVGRSVMKLLVLLQNRCTVRPGMPQQLQRHFEERETICALWLWLWVCRQTRSDLSA